MLSHQPPFVRLEETRPVPAGLPPDMADFYAWHEPQEPDGLDYSVCLKPLDDLFIGRAEDSKDLAWSLEGLPAWLSLETVHLGHDDFLDQIFYVASSPVRSCGGLYLVGPDVAGPQDSEQPGWILCIAESFAEWIERLRADQWVEYAVIPGEIDSLPRARQRELRSLFGRLNPGLEWGESAD